MHTCNWSQIFRCFRVVKLKVSAEVIQNPSNRHPKLTLPFYTKASDWSSIHLVSTSQRLLWKISRNSLPSLRKFKVNYYSGNCHSPRFDTFSPKSKQHSQSCKQKHIWQKLTVHVVNRGEIELSKILAVNANDIRYKKDHRLFKCPKCFKWNKTSYKCVVDKIFVVTCKKCGTRFSPSWGAGLSPREWPNGYGGEHVC